MIVLVAWILSGCAETSDVENHRNVSIVFEAQANGLPINCDTELTGLGTVGTSAALKDFRFYIHDLVLIKDTGEEIPLVLDSNIWQTGNVALVDFQDKSDGCAGSVKPTHTEVTGTIPDDDAIYNAVKFKLGVPTELNHNNPVTSPSPLNIPSLQWSWQAGYKFMRLDVAPVGGVTRVGDPEYLGNAWNVHLGSTNCTGAPVTCERNNRPTITLSEYDIETSSVVFDYGVLVEGNILSQDNGGHPGCASASMDPECSALFQKLGLDIDTGDTNASITQTVFSLK